MHGLVHYIRWDRHPCLSQRLPAGSAEHIGIYASARIEITHQYNITTSGKLTDTSLQGSKMAGLVRYARARIVGGAIWGKVAHSDIKRAGVNVMETDPQDAHVSVGILHPCMLLQPGLDKTCDTAMLGIKGPRQAMHTMQVPNWQRLHAMQCSSVHQTDNIVCQNVCQSRWGSI